jgi:hypothetical protein
MTPLRSFEPYTVASSQGLVSVNSAGNAILKIDNTTVGNRKFAAVLRPMDSS